jgi:hypothetical protein
MTRKSSLFGKITGAIASGDRWLRQTPDRALDEAYEAALMIQLLEDEHCQGQKPSVECL